MFDDFSKRSKAIQAALDLAGGKGWGEITLAEIENPRSRRRGTSNECSTCTHRNRDASEVRASSTLFAKRTLCRNAAKAANSATASTTFVPVFDRRRFTWE